MAKRFLYFLKNDQNQFYKETNGVVTVVGTPTPLTYTPDGWLEIEVERRRNVNLFAMERSFTVPLVFVKDGGTILKNIYYTQGIKAKVQLVIMEERLLITDTQYRIYYTSIYKGDIDLTKFLHEGAKVTLNLMEGGASKLLKANFTTDYELPMDQAFNVFFDGIKLQQEAKWIVTGFKQDNHTIGLMLVSQEGTTSIGAVNQDVYGVVNHNPDYWNSNSYFLLTEDTGTTVTIKWDFYATPRWVPPDDRYPQVDLQMELDILTGLDDPITRQIIQQISGSGSGFYNNKQHFQGSYTFSMPTNARAVLYMYMTHNSDVITMEYDAETSSFEAFYTYQKEATFVRAVRPFRVFQQLAAKMGINTVVSQVLLDYKYLVVTSGDALRQLDGAVIKTSMSKFFNSFNTILSLGMATEGNTLRLERKSYFVDYTNPVALGASKDAKVYPAEDYIYSAIKIGYPEQNYTDVNGKQEFNNTHGYTTGVVEVSKELTLISDYRADAYGATFTWINLDGKKTTDSSSDNDVFVLHVENPASQFPQLYYRLDRSLNPYAYGIIEKETIFNLFLSPTQCLLRHGSYIHSLFFKQDDLVIKYQTTEKNSALYIAQPGKPLVAENMDIPVGTLPAPFFTPNIIEFENVNPYDVLELFKQNPRRTFSTLIDGKEYLIFPQNDIVKPGSNEAQIFQGLSAPTNVLERLINYNGE